MRWDTHLYDARWFKSSRSGGNGGSCVEVAFAAPHIGIRDSKDRSGPALVCAPTAWSTFVTDIKTGTHDR